MQRDSEKFWIRRWIVVSVTTVVIVMAGCAPVQRVARPDGGGARDPSRLLVVDCLLPARVQQLGQKLTYLAPRRAIKTTQSDCEIRGGEYTAYDRSNYATALKIWLPQAEQGDPVAQTYVGEIYEKGLGVMADYALAAAWYRKAAEQGYARAMINLGFLYESGLGVEQDLVQAMNWYRKASGLEEAELEYVSSVERAKRRAAAEETERLREEVSSLQRELEQVRQQLRERQTKLEQEKQRAQSLRARLEAERRKLAATGGADGVANDAALRKKLEAAEAENAALDRQLASQRVELQRLQASLAARELEVNEAKKALAQASSRLEQMRENASPDALAKASAEQDKQARRVAALQAELDRVRAEYGAETERLKQGLAQSRQEQARLQQKLAGAAVAGKARDEALQARLERLVSQNAELQKALADSQQQQRQLAARAEKGERSADLQKQLAAAKERSISLERQLAAADKEQRHLQRQLMQMQVTGAEKSTRLAELEAQLAESEAAIARYEKEIAELNRKANASKVAVKEVPAEKVIATVTDGPAIEIIDPPMALTRSIPAVFAPSGLSTVEIIGKVTSPAKLLTFKMNGKKLPVNEAGLFQAEEPIGKKERQVEMLAIDNAGKKTMMKFMIIPKSGSADTAVAQGEKKSPSSKIEFGNYYALLIGNNEYEKLTDLKTPINDVKTVEKILRTKYGYKTELLLNATRYQILSALNKMREKLTENDNLLIYYAGHGELDGVNQRGFWLPVDAEPDNNANWISNVSITDMLNIMSAKHVMVVADSCYSGSLTRASIARLQGGMSAEKRNRWYKLMAKARTRTVLTSGGVKPVLDSGGGDHSIFAKAFIEVLQSNDSILEGSQLYKAVLMRVKDAARRLRVDQNPQYAPLKYAGHEAGEFFFLPKSRQAAAVGDRRALLALGKENGATMRSL